MKTNYMNISHTHIMHLHYCSCFLSFLLLVTISLIVDYKTCELMNVSNNFNMLQLVKL